jgi:hypothetical protein
LFSYFRIGYYYTVAYLGFLNMLYLSCRAWNRYENYGGDIGLEWQLFMKKILWSKFAKTNSVFLHLVIFCFLRFNQNLYWNSSTDFKFYWKICFRSRVIKFWIFVTIFATSCKNSKLYNSWTEAYFSMKFEICRWISM